MFQPAYNSIFFFLIKNIIEPGGVASAAHLLKPDVWIFLFYKCSFFFFYAMWLLTLKLIYIILQNSCQKKRPGALPNGYTVVSYIYKQVISW